MRNRCKELYTAYLMGYSQACYDKPTMSYKSFRILLKRKKILKMD